MAKLPCLVLVAGCLVLAATPVSAADDCSAVPELRQAAQRAAVDEITHEKIEALLNNAEGMCEAGKTEDLDVKLRNVRELLESDIEALPDPQQRIEVDPRQQG